jgi:hypothetical protein
MSDNKAQAWGRKAANSSNDDSEMLFPLLKLLSLWHASLQPLHS